MKKRNPAAVLLLPLVTFGIYSIYWTVKTKQEMVQMGADIPTAWLMIVPIANYWFLYKYSMGVEKVTGGKLNGLLVFIGHAVIGFIMSAIVQDSFNHVSDNTGYTAPAPVATPPAAAPIQ